MKHETELEILIRMACQDPAPPGYTRTSAWRSISSAHEDLYPVCQRCGDERFSISVHHVIPVSVCLSLELEPRNLISLCEGRDGCHLQEGHHGNFQRFNTNILREAREHLWVKIGAAADLGIDALMAREIHLNIEVSGKQLKGGATQQHQL